MHLKFNIPQIWRRSRSQLAEHLPRLLLPPREQPRYVRHCEMSQRIMKPLRYLNWHILPKTLGQQSRGYRTIPLCAYVGAFLVKIGCQLPTFGALHRTLREHPGLVWALGFPLVPSGSHRCGFDPERSLPNQRHFSRKLSEMPNEIVQNLLDEQVQRLAKQFAPSFGEIVAIDTKHILAWVRENNPKEYIKEGRFDPSKQPAGDPDCKVGCKRKRNQTPTQEGQPASEQVSIGEYYWGYASGVAATKVAEGGEFVLAELTQTFDRGDTTYFLPLMEQVEARLGRRPRYGAADAAFDAFYIYDYFHSEDHDGFAAVPLRQMRHGNRRFDSSGLPLCDAELPMTLTSSYTNRTSAVQHQRGRYRCPLLHPEPIADACPVNHKKWPDGGCNLVMPNAPGARIRYQLDRQSDLYQHIYSQRTCVERIFSQATALGIERPKLRNRLAIANYNSLIYLTINLRTLSRLASLSS